jgi:hypothetical protein
MAEECEATRIKIFNSVADALATTRRPCSGVCKVSHDTPDLAGAIEALPMGHTIPALPIEDDGSVVTIPIKILHPSLSMKHNTTAIPIPPLTAGLVWFLGVMLVIWSLFVPRTREGGRSKRAWSLEKIAKENGSV